jgi:phage-related protein
MPEFQFNPEYGVSVNYSIFSNNKELGDCFEILGIPTGKIIEESWNLSGTVTDLSSVDIIQNYQGINPLEWRLRKPKPVGETTYNWELGIDNLGEYIADKWNINQIASGLWKVQFTFSKWNHWYIDECSIKDIDLLEDYPNFPFEITYNSNRSFNIKTLTTRKNGGIETRTRYGYNSSVDTWSLSKTVSESERQLTNNFMRDLASRPFRFRNNIYTCMAWSNTYIAPYFWQIDLSFKRSYQPFRKSALKQAAEDYDITKTKEETLAKLQESVNDTNLDLHLNGAISWLLRWQKADYPYILNAQYVLRNSFHKVLGRGGYFPSSGAPTEAQAVITRACAYAFQVTGDVRYKNLAIACGNALLNYFYPLKIESNWTPDKGIRVPHWLITTESFVTKGKVSSDPLNYGFFDLILNFNNGITTIPNGSPNFGELLSDVYRVYPETDQLLWQNVYAEPLGGFWWDIEYWTSNILLEGVIVRYYPESSQPGGKAPTQTNENPGIIKLKTNYTGTAKVVYAAYVGAVVPANTGFEAYPMWRLLRPIEALGAIDVFPWASDAYESMTQIEPTNPIWAVAYNCNKYTEAISAEVINLTHWYKKDDVLNPFAYPGSQIVIVPKNDRIVNNSRVISGDKKDFLQVVIPTSTAQYPSIEFSNYAVTATLDDDTTVYVEVACSITTELELIISLKPNPFDFSQYYKRYLPVVANVTTIANFNKNEFILWDEAQTVWHTRIADNPIYTYKGDDGVANIVKEYPEINGIRNEVFKITLSANGNFAGAGLVTKGIAPDLLGRLPTLPFTMEYKVQGTAIIKLTIAGKEYRKTIQTTDWVKSSFQSNEFKDFDNKTPSGNIITNFEFVASPTASQVWIFWVGQEPYRLLGTLKSYKAVIVSRLKVAHTLWIGDFKPIGSPSDILPYNPGVVPFTVNVFDDGSGTRQTVEGWRGAPATGYQYPGWYVKMGYWDRLRQVLQFLEDAQEAYRQQNKNKTYGVFAPTYVWGYWDSLQLEKGQYDFFSFQGVDPNTNWEGYQIRPAESVAHAWYRMAIGEFPTNIPLPTDFEKLKAQAKKISMGFINWLSSYYLRNKKFQPPTDFYAEIDPVSNYRTIHFAAIALRMFIYANIADISGRNSSVTLRGIKASYDFLKCNFVTSGLMEGSFSRGQPIFNFNSMQLFEYFGFWHLEAVESIALLKTNVNNLRISDCCTYIKDICYF